MLNANSLLRPRFCNLPLLYILCFVGVLFFHFVTFGNYYCMSMRDAFADLNLLNVDVQLNGTNTTEQI